MGKSALLTRLAEVARDDGYDVIRLHGSGDTSVVAALLEEATTRADRVGGRWEAAKRGLTQLSGVSVSVAGFGVGVDRDLAQPSLDQPHPESLAATLAALADGVRDDTGAGLVVSPAWS